MTEQIKKLLTLNAMGLIPGPNEDKTSFFKRTDYCLNLTDHLPKELIADLNGERTEKPEILTQAADQLKKLYDCAPDWPPLFFSNYKLPFWHGGCAWIFQMTEDSPTAALIQLRQKFRFSSTHLGIYDRQELLTHELAHVGRMMFQEPKFEELLAFRTSSSSLRRWLGPIIQSSAESALFLLLLFVLVIFDVFLVAMNRPDAYFMAFWLKIIPIAVLLLGGFRLWKRQKTFASCIKNLSECVDPEKAYDVAYRLTDEEIIRFSKLSSHEINEYAIQKKNEELRWSVITHAYFTT
jgi:hypothetical protein